EQRRVRRIDFDARELGWVARALAADQFIERNETRARIAKNYPMFQRRLLDLDALDQGTEIVVPVLVRRDAAHRARDANELADLEIAMRRQRHHRNGTDFLEREIEIGELDAVRELDHETIER